MNARSLRFRITAWYSGLLAGALLIFGASVYLGLERYLYWDLQRTLGAECRTIGTQLLPHYSSRREAWLETEIIEAYAPEVNSKFVRVIQEGVGTVYVSGEPKDGAFDPEQVPLPTGQDKSRSRRIRLVGARQLMIETMQFTTPDGGKFTVESGVPYHQVEVVLHGLLVTFHYFAGSCERLLADEAIVATGGRNYEAGRGHHLHELE